VTGPRVFQWIADRYPTPLVGRSPVLYALWRGICALLRPRLPVTLRTADYRMRIDPRRRHVARSILHRCAYDPLTTDRFRAAVRRGTVVVDVGANVGHYALVAAAALRGTGEVLAYEPEPGTFRELVQNVDLNGFANVVARPVAVSDRRGTTQLFVDSENEGGHSLAEANTRRAGGPVTVETVPLDQECHGRDVSVLKIDAQGAEGAVLRGAMETLSRCRAVVFLELWPHGMRRCGDDPLATLDAIRALGYRARVIERRRGRIRDPAAGELERVCRGDDRSSAVNLLLEKP
jgi:FkbM family methyltransferase